MNKNNIYHNISTTTDINKYIKEYNKLKLNIFKQYKPINKVIYK